MNSYEAKSNPGFSIIELAVVIGILAVFLGIALPLLARLRINAMATKCAMHLAQLGNAFNAYASENDGVLPRAAPYGGSRGPTWMEAASRHLGRPSSTWAQLRATQAFHCPANTVPEVPTSYVVNAFYFSDPGWNSVAGATKLSKIRSPASLPWLLEAPDFFKTFTVAKALVDDVFFEITHYVSTPDHLPEGATPRIYPARHRHSSNLLFADGHVEARSTSEKLSLHQFDDRIRRR